MKTSHNALARRIAPLQNRRRTWRTTHALRRRTTDASPTGRVFSLAQPRAECQIHGVVNTGRRVCSEHDTTRESPVADRLASATHGKVQDIARSSWPSAKISFANRPPLVAQGLTPRRAGVFACRRLGAPTFFSLSLGRRGRGENGGAIGGDRTRPDSLQPSRQIWRAKR